MSKIIIEIDEHDFERLIEVAETRHDILHTLEEILEQIKNKSSASALSDACQRE
jgi:hypothetical protein